MQQLAPQLVVALDNCSQSEARLIATELSAAGVSWFKIGLELFSRSGPSFVSELKAAGSKIFVDLKLHDIPNTVGKATKAIASLGADLLTVHCSGGREMLRAAQEAAQGSQLSVVGVTVLTSLDEALFSELSEAWGAKQGSAVPRSSVSLSLAKLAAEAALSGIVCSVSDLHDGQLKRLPWGGEGSLFVTPGIRGPLDAKRDQKSTATATQAVIAGASHIVVGRPITDKPREKRVEAALKFLKEIQEAYAIPANPQRPKKH